MYHDLDIMAKKIFSLPGVTAHLFRFWVDVRINVGSGGMLHELVLPAVNHEEP